jgi:transposase
LWRCRTLYNVALEERKTAWEKRRVSLNHYQQATELPDLKAACPEYAEVNAQVLQDALRRLDRAFQAFFRRIRNVETPGYPRFQDKGRYNSFTYPQYGGGAVAARWRRGVGRWCSQPLQDWPHLYTPTPLIGGDAQDGHNQPRSRWLVCMLFLR